MTSAASNQRALDTIGGHRQHLDGHSPFAAALLEALDGAADFNGDGLLTATELYLYIRDRVQDLTSSTASLLQTPGLFPLRKHESGEYVFQVPGKPLRLPSAPELTPERNPFRGLQNHEEQHADLFFGREDVLDELVPFVQRHPLTVVVGPSGTGKSSLVLAGPLPRLRRPPDGRGWRVVGPVRPTQSPALTLQRVEDQVLAQAGEDELLIVVDQLEELVAYRTAAAVREAFLSGFSALLKQHGSHIHIVVTVRSDFEPQLQDMALAPWWRDARFVVPPKNQDNLRAAIVGPTEARELHFEPPRLVERLINEVVQTPGALPLLSFTLSELYDRCLRQHDSRRLTEEQYHELGGVSRALTQRASAELLALAELDVGFRSTLRRIMLRMMSQNAGEVARRRVLRAELVFDEDEENARVEQALNAFLAARLLVAGTEPDIDGLPATYVEPAHDALVRGWSVLQLWREEVAAEWPVYTATWAAAANWGQHKQAPGLLWVADPRLPQLEVVLSRDDHLLNKLETEFANKSATMRRRRVRRLRIVVSTVLLALLGFSGVLLFLWKRANAVQREAERSLKKAQNAALFSAARAENDPERRAALLREMATPGPPGWQQAAFDACHLNGNLALRGHEGPVLEVAISPDGTKVVTGSGDNTARVWDLRNLGSSIVLGGHLSPVRAVAFSPDGTHVVTGSDDNTARVWNADGSGKPTILRWHNGEVRYAAFSANGDKVITLSWDKSVVRVWGTSDGREIGVVSVSSSVGDECSTHAAALNFVRVATPCVRKGSGGLADRYFVRVLRVDGKGDTVILEGHTDEIKAVAISPDGLKVISGSDDKTARIWRADGPQRPIVLDGNASSVEAVAFSPDGSKVATGSRNSAKVWNVDGEGKVAEFNGHTSTIRSVRFTADGSKLVTTSYDGSIRVWSIEDSGEPMILPSHPSYGWDAHIDVSADGSKIVTTSESIAHVWRLGDSWQPVILRGYAGAVNALAVSPDGAKVASGSSDHTVRVWNIDGSGSPMVLQGQREAVNAVTFSSDGRYLFAAYQGGGVMRWNADGARNPIFLGGPGSASAVAICGDGSMIVSGGSAPTPGSQDGDTLADGEVCVWAANNSHKFVSLRGNTKGVRAVAISADRSKVAAGTTDKMVRVWNADGSGSPVVLTGHVLPVRTLAFSPDSSRIASGADDAARIWNVDGSGSPTVLQGHESSVTSIAFSPDGSKVATGSLDTSVRVWPADGLGESLVLRGHSGEVRSVGFSPDGQKVVSAGVDGTVRVRTLDARTLLWMRYGRCPTWDERQSLLGSTNRDARNAHRCCKLTVDRCRQSFRVCQREVARVYDQGGCEENLAGETNEK